MKVSFEGCVFDLKTAIESLLAGKPIHPAETKAFGCEIARR